MENMKAEKMHHSGKSMFLLAAILFSLQTVLTRSVFLKMYSVFKKLQIHYSFARETAFNATSAILGLD